MDKPSGKELGSPGVAGERNLGDWVSAPSEQWQDMALHYRRQADKLIVFGQTFPVKESIKALGGRFNGVAKNWTVPYSETNLARLQDMCGDEATEDPVGTNTETLEPATPQVRVDRSLQKTLKPEALSLRELMDKAALAVTSAFPTPVWVMGEVENFSRRGDTVFLNLAEAKVSGTGSLTVKATIWNNTVRSIKQRHGDDALDQILSDGLQVCLLCSVTLYKDRGHISLNVEDIDPQFTKGALAIAREKLLKELRQKGLDRAQKALTLPRLPLRIVLLSAEGSRAQSDFLHQLEVGNFPGTVWFQHTAMQGERVGQMVVAGLKRALKVQPDVIVITRGGGSAADLRWFDGKDVAYAIAECPVPIIAAIGHHDDLCVAEEIAHRRQKTPTAAADFLVEQVARVLESLRESTESLSQNLSRRLLRAIEAQSQLKARLYRSANENLNLKNRRQSQLSDRLARILTGRLHDRLEGLSRLVHQLDRAAAGQFMVLQRRLDGSWQKLDRGADVALQQWHDSLNLLDRTLAGLDPSPWLKKGWTRLQHEGRNLKSIDQANVDDAVTARLLDGLLQLRVEKKTKVVNQTRQHPHDLSGFQTD